MMNTAMGATVVEGNAHSPVRVVIFEDLQGADCAKFQAMLDVTLLQGSHCIRFVHLSIYRLHQSRRVLHFEGRVEFESSGLRPTLGSRGYISL